MMRRRVLTFLFAGLVVLGSVLGCIPMRSSAIVPLGFVQSALASYVSSTGYKLYNDNGTGQDILGSLGELYDDYVTIADKTITGQLANLAFLANSPYIYQDNSGQIVVSKVAADIFQDFADWIQTEYSVPVGSDTPTTVLNGTPGMYTNANGSWMALSPGTLYSFEASPVTNDNFLTYKFTVLSSSAPVYLWRVVNNTITADAGKWCLQSKESFTVRTAYINRYGRETSNDDIVNRISNYDCAFLSRQGFNVYPSMPVFAFSSPVAWSLFDGAEESGGVAGLGVTLAQAVADVVGQAKEDDAVVIGVGASVGSTAQDIADMVAQGVKSQTLDPSVSITAESVIDTPVQPYPDIDGLGLPELGAALVSRFPFCIPWDFVDTVKLLNADPVAPDIAVDLFPAAFKSKVGISGSTEFRINLGDEKYQKIGMFCRWGSLIGFCFGLAMLTKRMIWTA